MPNVIPNPLNRESLVTKSGILRALGLEGLGLSKPEDYANNMSATPRNPTEWGDSWTAYTLADSSVQHG